MPSLLSFAVQAFVLSLLCPAVLSRERQSRPRRLEDLIQNKRGICYDDDTLESFKYWIVDSVPYCSSLLNIVDFTQTVSGISRT